MGELLYSPAPSISPSTGFVSNTQLSNDVWDAVLAPCGRDRESDMTGADRYGALIMCQALR